MSILSTNSPCLLIALGLSHFLLRKLIDSNTLLPVLNKTQNELFWVLAVSSVRDSRIRHVERREWDH